MGGKRAWIWYGKEGDYLEAKCQQRAGGFRETANLRSVEKVDEKRTVFGISLMKISALRGRPVEVVL